MIIHSRKIVQGVFLIICFLCFPLGVAATDLKPEPVSQSPELSLSKTLDTQKLENESPSSSIKTRNTLTEQTVEGEKMHSRHITINPMQLLNLDEIQTNFERGLQLNRNLHSNALRRKSNNTLVKPVGGPWLHDNNDTQLTLDLKNNLTLKLDDSNITVPPPSRETLLSTIPPSSLLLNRSSSLGVDGNQKKIKSPKLSTIQSAPKPYHAPPFSTKKPLRSINGSRMVKAGDKTIMLEEYIDIDKTMDDLKDELFLENQNSSNKTLALATQDSIKMPQFDLLSESQKEREGKHDSKTQDLSDLIANFLDDDSSQTPTEKEMQMVDPISIEAQAYHEDERKISEDGDEQQSDYDTPQPNDDNPQSTCYRRYTFSQLVYSGTVCCCVFSISVGSIYYFVFQPNFSL